MSLQRSTFIVQSSVVRSLLCLCYSDCLPRLSALSGQTGRFPVPRGILINASFHDSPRGVLHGGRFDLAQHRSHTSPFQRTSVSFRSEQVDDLEAQGLLIVSRLTATLEDIMV